MFAHGIIFSKNTPSKKGSRRHSRYIHAIQKTTQGLCSISTFPSKSPSHTRRTPTASLREEKLKKRYSTGGVDGSETCVFCTSISHAENQIPNEVLKVIMPEIGSYLEQIFNDSLSLGYYPSHFKESIIIILRKEGATRDYTNPKSYRPISLLNTVEKLWKQY